MSVLTVHVQHEFNSDANTYLNGSISCRFSICSAGIFFIFDEPSLLHGDNFSHRWLMLVVVPKFEGFPSENSLTMGLITSVTYLNQHSSSSIVMAGRVKHFSVYCHADQFLVD